MKKKVLVFIVSLLILVSVVGMVMAAEEDTTTATVTVNSFVDITIGGVIPIDFGSVDPGTFFPDNPAGGAITITIESITNIDTDTYLRGDDWTAPATLAINKVKYDDDATLGEGTEETGNLEATMLATYPVVANNGYFEDVACPCGGSAVVKSTYYWLSVPSGQKAGVYTATNVYFKTVEDGVLP